MGHVLGYLTQRLYQDYKTLTLRDCPGFSPLIHLKQANSQGQFFQTFDPTSVSRNIDYLRNGDDPINEDGPKN